MKKLLVLGIGHAQVDVIKTAKDLGVEVYACAGSEIGPGRELVKNFKKIDIKDYEKITQYAKQIKADALFSAGLEISIDTIAKVSEKLSLPSFFEPEIISEIKDKGLWRNKIKKVPGSVKFKLGSSSQDFKYWNTFPAIIKPVDGSGQRGVYKVNNFSEISNYLELSLAHSSKKEVIVEEFIGGFEISVNTFMKDGNLVYAFISDRISYDQYPGGIIKEHHIPSRKLSEDLERKTIELVKGINQAIGFTDGQIYFQLKVFEGKVYLIEFMPRFDACHMWQLIYLATGINLLKICLEELLFGYSVTLENSKNANLTYMKTKFISDVPSTIVNKDNYKVPLNPNFIKWYYKEGEKVKKVTGFMEKIGYYMIKE